MNECNGIIAIQSLKLNESIINIKSKSIVYGNIPRSLSMRIDVQSIVVVKYLIIYFIYMYA